MDESIEIPRLSTAPLVGSLHGKTRAYIAFIWLGLGTLLPLNFFITAGTYFCDKLKDPNSNKTFIPLNLLYESTVISCASLANLITVILVTVKFVPYIHNRRIFTSLSVIIVCFAISLTLALLEGTKQVVLFFIVTMILVMIQSVCSAVLMNSFFSLASTLPSRYIQGFGSGQALGGVFLAICSIISLLPVSSSLSNATAVYFAIAIFVILSNMVVYYFLEKTHLFQIYSSAAQVINNEYEPLFHETSSTDDASNVVNTVSNTINQRLWTSYRHVKWNFWGMFLTFVATFSVFPAALSKIRSVHSTTPHGNKDWPDRLFVPVMTFLLFFVGETIGRVISSKVHRPHLSYPRLLFIMCLLRFLFIPLFALCNFPLTKGHLLAFKHDTVYGILVLIFAASHGYCNSLNSMYAPRRVQEQLSSTVGALMMMAIAAGMFFGSVLSYGVFVAFRLVDLAGDHTCDRSTFFIHSEF